MVLLFGQLAAMYPKPKHLKHFVLEVLVGDLGVEMERVVFRNSKVRSGFRKKSFRRSFVFILP